MTLAEQAATGSADREAVAIALGLQKVTWKSCAAAIGPLHTVVWERNSIAVYAGRPPNYQTDLAATLAEIERRGWGYECTRIRGKMPVVCIDNGTDVRATGTTIANAACAALLRALEPKP